MQPEKVEKSEMKTMPSAFGFEAPFVSTLSRSPDVRTWSLRMPV